MKLSEIPKPDEINKNIQFVLNTESEICELSVFLSQIGYDWYYRCSQKSFPRYIVLYTNGKMNELQNDACYTTETIEWDNIQNRETNYNTVYCSCSNPNVVKAFSGITKGEWYNFCRNCKKEKK